MFHSIVVARGEEEVRQVVLELQSAGRKKDQIQILARQQIYMDRIFSPKKGKRGAAEGRRNVEEGIQEAELRNRLLSLGLSPSAVAYYEQQLASGHIVIAVDEEDMLRH